MDLPFYTYQALRNPRDIRLIRIQSGQRHENIVCDIVHGNLDHSPRYEALSYTWGDPTTGRQITCQEPSSTLAITSNCESALKRLRRRDTSRTLWIDAVCIDQTNLQERSDQVQLMWAIYAQANKALVYVGDDSSDSAIAMDFIAADYKTLTSTHESRPSIGLDSGGPITSQQKAIENMLRRPWFERVWVLQEVHFASEVEVLCGDRSVPWEALVLTATYLNTTLKELREASAIEKIPNIIHVREKPKADESPGLLQRLLDTRHCKSTDPRDKIYALLNMVTEPSEVFADYTRSKEDVYKWLARFMIDRDCCLDVLSGVQGKPVKGLPSWVPDWSQPPVSDVLGRPGGWRKRFNANNNHSSLATFTADSSIITVAGKAVDMVCAISEEYRLDNPDSRSTLQTWDQEAKILDSYPTVQPISVAFLETLMAFPRSKHYETPHTAVKMFSQSWRLRWLDKVPPPDVAYTSSLAAKEAHIFNEMVIKACNGHRFFRTQKGYMGLGPKDIRNGDTVSVLLGGQVSFILRKLDDTYMLIGESYVHGIMNGEAVDDADFEIQSFRLG